MLASCILYAVVEAARCSLRDFYLNVELMRIGGNKS
jgi:hypothetical protein